MAFGDGGGSFDAGLSLSDPGAAASLGIDSAAGDYGSAADSSSPGSGDGSFYSGGNQSGQSLSPAEQAALALSDPEAAASIGIGSAQGDFASTGDFYSDAGNYDRQTDIAVPSPRGGLAGFIDSLIGIDRSATSFRDGTMGPVEGRFDFFNSPLIGALATLINPALGAAYGVGRGVARGDLVGAILGGAGLIGNLASPFSTITGALNLAATGNSLYGFLNDGRTLTSGIDLGIDFGDFGAGGPQWGGADESFPGDAVSVSNDTPSSDTGTYDAPQAPSQQAPMMQAPDTFTVGAGTQAPSTSDSGTQSYLSPGLRRTTYGNIQTGDTAPSDDGAINRGYAAARTGRWRQASAQLAA